MQQTCGNCGKPVGTSDITCPHCDALLAAYASPTGATSAPIWAGSEPIPGAVPPVQMDEPAPAPKTEIAVEVEAVSSAPRPLFDTNVTIDELMKAADGELDENLVVVDEEKAVSKPVEFDRPDYARPPSATKPVPVIEEADPELIARPADEDVRTENVADQDETEPPAGDDALAESPSARSGKAPIRSGFWKEPATGDDVDRERGRTEAYLRKLHAKTGYDAKQEELSRPLETGASRKGPLAGAWKGRDVQNTQSTTQWAPQGCSSVLGIVLFFLWVRVVFGIIDGDVGPGIIFMAVALSFVYRLLGTSLPWAGKR